MLLGSLVGQNRFGLQQHTFRLVRLPSHSGAQCIANVLELVASLLPLMSLDVPNWPLSKKVFSATEPLLTILFITPILCKLSKF